MKIFIIIVSIIILLIVFMFIKNNRIPNNIGVNRKRYEDIKKAYEAKK